jgi:hypothetical protein
MTIDFTDDELDVIYDALEEMRISIEDDNTLLMIEEITDKMWKASKNGNS